MLCAFLQRASAAAWRTGMANFQKNGKNVHGQVLTASAGQAFEIGLWGPLDIRTTPPTELTVTATPPFGLLERGNMVPGGNIRTWRLLGLTAGSRVFLEAKDSGGAVWSSVTIETSVPSSATTVVTKAQVTNSAGVIGAKFPPSPAVISLISILTKATNGELKAGPSLLESAGGSGLFDEHNAGVSVDIFRLSTDPDQQRQAHNLLRFFILTRKTLGWQHMFYESWGFSPTGVMGGSPGHGNHIHIDWLDFSKIKFDGPNQFDRSKWTEVTWIPEAMRGTAIDNEANESLVSTAWNDTSAPILTTADLPGLYT